MAIKEPSASPPKTLEGLQNIPIKQLPRPAKIVTVQALHDLQFSVKKIAEILELGERSIWRYLEETETPQIKEWQDYGVAIKKLFEAKENDVQAKVLMKLESQLDSAKFYELSGLYKIISDAKRENNKLQGMTVQQAVVFNITKDKV